MNEIRGELLRGHLEAMVLAVLAGGEAHGFEVARRLESAGCGALRLKEGSLYPALYRLEAAGLVRGRWEDGVSGRRGPRRRFYRLTRRGSQRLADARHEWRFFSAVMGSILGVQT